MALCFLVDALLKAVWNFENSGSGRYVYGYYLLLLIPFIPFIFSFLATGAAWIWSRKVGQRTYGGFRTAFMCENDAQVRRYFMHCIKQSIPFLGVVYNNVCLMAFGTFACMSMRDGTKLLKAAPSIECWTSEEHKWLIGISIRALVFYVIGIPALTLGSTLYAKRNDKLKDPEWLLVFGLYYREYGERRRKGRCMRASPHCS